MKYTWKRAVSLLSALALVLAMTACGKENHPEEATADCRFRAFFGSHRPAEEVEEMLSLYGTESGILIEGMTTEENDERALRSALEGSDPPLIFTVNSREEAQQLKEDGWLLDLSGTANAALQELLAQIPAVRKLSGPNDENLGLPGGVNGCGLIFDEALIAGLFGEESAETFAEDCRNATWDEWRIFVEEAERCLSAPSGERIFLGGKPYRFLSEKPADLKRVNGIFAFPGADESVYGEQLLNLAISGVWADEAEVEETMALQRAAASVETTEAAMLTTQEAVAAVRGITDAWAGGLELMTAHLAGQYSAGIRGADFVSSANYSLRQAQRIFMQGNALFAFGSNMDYEALTRLNAEKALRLQFLPVKFPFGIPLYSPATGVAKDGTAEAEGASETAELPEAASPRPAAEPALWNGGLTPAAVNTSLPVEVTYYYCINAKADLQRQQEALDFLVWLARWSSEQENTLDHSLNAYFRAGEILNWPVRAVPQQWRSAIVGSEGMGRLLTVKRWTEEDFRELSERSAAEWLSAAESLRAPGQE